MELGHPSLAVNAMRVSCHRVQHTPSNSIHPVKHPTCMASTTYWQSPAHSQSLMFHLWCHRQLLCTLHYTFPHSGVLRWIQSWLWSCLPSNITPPGQSSTSTPSVSHDRCLSRPPSVCPNLLSSSLPTSHDHGLQMHLQTPSITASKFE